MFHKDTEVFTQYGWKKVENLTESDLVLQYNEKSTLLTFVKPDILSRHYSGLMIELTGAVNFCVTPNHKLYMRLIYYHFYSPALINVLRKRQAKSLKVEVKYHLPVCGLKQGKTKTLLSQQKFLVIYTWYGERIDDETLYFRVIYAQRKVEFKKVVEECGYEYYSKKGKQNQGFYVKVPSYTFLTKNFQEWDLNYLEIDKAWCDEFFKYIKFWNTKVSHPRNELYTYTICDTIPNMEFVSTLASLCKYKTVHMKDTRRYLGRIIPKIKVYPHVETALGYVDWQRVTSAISEEKTAKGAPLTKKKNVHYNGQIYEIRVPNKWVMIKSGWKTLIM